MQHGNITIGYPIGLYKGTQAELDALNLPEGYVAFRTGGGLLKGLAISDGSNLIIYTGYDSEIQLDGYGGFEGILAELTSGYVADAMTLLDLHDHGHPCCGRLTLESGVAVSTTDQSAKTTLYFAPFRGDRMALYDGSRWHVYAFSELSLALAGLAASKPHDIYVYDDAGTPTLEALVWTNATTRATALALQNGVLVKSGDATRRYLGTIYVNSSGGQTDDTITKRNVWNYYNRVFRRLYVAETTNHTYNGANRLWNNSEANNRIEFVVGVVEDAPTLYVRPTIKAGADGNYANVPLYLDGAGTGHGIINYNNQYIVSGVTFPYTVAAGYHYANAYEAGDHASSTFANVLLGGGAWG